MGAEEACADVVLTGNSVVNGGSNLVSSPVVSTNGVGNGTSTNPWVYAVSAPMNLGAYVIRTTNYLTESFKLDLGGNPLTGSSGVISLSTVPNYAYGVQTKAGSISIVNARAVTLGAIDTHGTGNGAAAAGHDYAGAINIGEPLGTNSGPVGGVSVDALLAYATYFNYQPYEHGAPITVYSTGSVSVTSNIVTTTGNGDAGDVNILHQGSFSAADILSSQNNGSSDADFAGRVTCSGNYVGTGPVGALQVRTIDSSYYRAQYGISRRAGGDITIRGYTGVRVTGNLLSLCNGDLGGGRLGAGLITITNITGDIQVDGAINSVASKGTNYSGAVTMIASGRIQLASLDLALVGSNTVLAATGKTYVVGAFLNFQTNKPANGWLNAPAGATIGYNAALVTNAYLAGATYTLKSGGQLVPMPAVDVSAGAGNVTVTEADLRGRLGTSSVPASVTLFWGTNAAAWSVTNNLGTLAPGALSVHVTGLLTNTTYYYAFLATNADFPAVPAAVAAPFTTLVDVSGWGRRMKISLGGYNRPETLTNFPLAVTLNESLPGFLYGAFSSTNGYDLRFYNAGLTRELNYEIEGRWNPTGNTFVWVQVDRIATSNDYIWAYWKNPSATAAAPAYTTNGATWADGYVGVWHMSQTNATDSSANRFQGSVSGAVTQMVAGVFGPANRLSGNNYITVPYNSAFTLANDYTIGGWFWLGGTSDQGVLGTYSPGFMLSVSSSTLQFYDGANWRSSGIAASALTNGWKYLVYTRSGSVNRFCLNGSNTTTLATGAATTGGGALTFGRANTWGNNNYNGPMDEVRISTVARSTNWVWAEYMNIASNASFLGFSTTESVQMGVPVITGVGAFNVDTNAADLVANLSSGAAPVTVTCYWGTNDGVASAASWMTNAPCGALSPPLYVTNHVTGLLPGTLYYFRFFASNVNDMVWAPLSTSFVTPGAPAVDNLAPANVAATGARLQGQVLGGGPIPETWIYWGTNDGGTVKANWSQAPISIGPHGATPFSQDVSGLLANQTYWYRCYVSNAFNGGSEAWAPASTNFTTPGPDCSIADTGVPEGAPGVNTTAVFAVTLSAVSAVAVSVDWGTSNGTAQVVNNDYQAVSGTLSIPAGQLTGSVSVVVVGDNALEANETFYVNLSNAVATAILRGTAAGVITNDDFTVYVRGDGMGSDTNNGVSWSNALATLQKALDSVPVYQVSQRASGSVGPFTIHVQASAGAQSYAACARNYLYSGVVGRSPIDAVFQGGWLNVDVAPAQTGVSRIMDATTNHAGISITSSDHFAWKKILVNRFAFTNVTRGVELVSADSAFNNVDTLLTLSNCTIRAQNDGAFLHYVMAYPTSNYGAPVRVTAVNVDVLAGLGGAGDGLRVEGSWMGSSVAADGVDPATGAPRVSTIRSLTGRGIVLTSMNNSELCDATFSNVVVYNCASNGISLDVAIPGSSGSTPYITRATLRNCTLAGNGSNGLYLVSQTAGSWASITNCIVANNGSGHGVKLDSTNGAFTCSEGYNVFFGNDVLTNGAVMVLSTNSSTANPLFYGQGAKPSPWYLLSSATSPAYRRGSDGRNRGAYQNDKIPSGTLLLLQ
jgi:hypothetical protein